VEASSSKAKIELVERTPQRWKVKVKALEPTALRFSRAFEPFSEASLEGKKIEVKMSPLFQPVIQLEPGDYLLDYKFKVPVWVWAFTFLSILLLLISKLTFKLRLK
jgi:hypothetical protein